MNKPRKNQQGQIAIEMILILALLMGIVAFVSKEFQSRGFVAQLISKPWKSLAGMIQNGVWGPSADTMPQHPNSFRRVATPDGEETQ